MKCNEDYGELCYLPEEVAILDGPPMSEAVVPPMSEAVVPPMSEAVVEGAVPEETEPRSAVTSSFEWFEEFDNAYVGTPPGPLPVPGTMEVAADGDSMAAMPLSKSGARALAREEGDDTPPSYHWRGKIRPLGASASSSMGGSSMDPFSIRGVRRWSYFLRACD